ncbi:calcium-binding protein [Pseudomonas aegrilactucae]|uniref:M10 family metallopeptidase C-terminal domain-containing protein n=1 Tax=Pseudomonas aegrilactucae TaxID=2854028 RepID=A0A9Q2XIC8_9PSED|nr:M10 family metallopeptidase C-terminal domain-containing protein [Pseudomonas aegrilactucae]MBV6287617.1 M10 family metallopeptidase C-terminal domain-containing protein [Pseudomonas aegrilactucae]
MSTTKQGRLDDAYKFTLVGGKVKAVYEYDDGRFEREQMERGETWTVQGTNVRMTEREKGVTETEEYADVNGDGIYFKVSETHVGSSGHDRISGDSTHDRLFGKSGNDQLWGGAGNDYLRGDAGNDVIDAGAGKDQIVGGAGNDTYKGGAGVDTVIYSSARAGLTVDLNKGVAGATLTRGDAAGIGRDTLTGIENVTGGDFHDRLIGNAQNNQLSGGAGNDLLHGGLGRDVLSGGAGKDVFTFASVQEAGNSSKTRDVITDFAKGDKINLSGIDAIAGGRTNEAFKFVGDAGAVNAANAKGALWFSKGVVYGSTDGDVTPEFQIQVSGVNSMTAADFVL